jgi:hypothetical protein
MQRSQLYHNIPSVAKRGAEQMDFGPGWVGIGLTSPALLVSGYIYDQWTNCRHQKRAERKLGAWVIGGVFATLWLRYDQTP